MSSLAPALLWAAPVEFDLPAGSAAESLLAFSRQAQVDVLFSYDELSKVNVPALQGHLEPEDALNRLLRDTGYAARRTGPGKFVVTVDHRPTGAVRGKLLLPDGQPAKEVRVRLSEARQSAVTNARGEFEFPTVPPGTYQLLATTSGYRPLQVNGVKIQARHVVTLEPQTMQIADDLTRLDPYVVEGKAYGTELGRGLARPAIGNLDLQRSQNDALPFEVYSRDQLMRSGVVHLNDFLRREVIDSDASRLPADQNGQEPSFMSGSSNLNLRGYGAEQTVVMVNGRRMPESGVPDDNGYLPPPDANLIPLSLVQQVEVLPISTAALYSGNAVGGTINIVLRDIDATEITATYTNALRNFDAPQSSFSLLHGETMLDDRLHFRLSATFTETTPPTEAELGYHRDHDKAAASPLDAPVYRATPNVRSADINQPLLPTWSSPVTSVAPGADGTGGLAPFASRQGVRNFDFFDGAGGYAPSPNSIDYPYGRRQRRESYLASVTYDVTPWLQFGLDGSYSYTVVNRGFDIVSGELSMAAGASNNPFPQDIVVSLNDFAPRLGEGYNEAHLQSYSIVGGVIIKMPADWRVTFDGQYTRSLAEYRGLAGVDPNRWQSLVDEGIYHPLRDTQVHGPPAEFYDRALVYYDGVGQFATMGDYNILDGAVRVTNDALNLPTGRAVLNFGGDYRRTELADYTRNLRLGNGQQAYDPAIYDGRTLERMSVFGELQAPLFPANKLPSWLRNIETDLAARYTISDESEETSFAPTIGLKFDFTGGLSVRGSFTTSNRFPPPQMRQPISVPGGGPGGSNLTRIVDPLRNGEEYFVEENVIPSPNLSPESAVTQTAGLIYQRGTVHRFRASLDFVDTHKTDELITLAAQDAMNLETYYPERVVRAPLAPGDPYSVGRPLLVYTGSVNVAWRHSQNWNTSVDYSWMECLGGRFDVYARWVYFQKYESQVLPDSAVIDQLSNPNGAASGVLRHRANFGAGWSNRDFGFGVDGHYLHSRTLPVGEQVAQGSDHIEPYWQFDVFLQAELGRWLPWNEKHHGLRAQLRVNNVFGADFPEYAAGPASSGVQPYGDWRGPTYSLSVTASF